MEIRESLLKDLPDEEAARRFFGQFAERHHSAAKKLLKNEGLLSDVLTLASFSPLLAATLLQNPEYLAWLNRHRGDAVVRDKEELLESLARFAMTNSETEPHVLLARFRRRELLRIFLGDVRRLATVSESTEELSNLADAVLEFALRIARQQLDNRYGIALEQDAKGRVKPSDFAIVSLGKLGSKELNYSSDIDLLFLYSAEGATSGQGARDAVTNREYFVKLAETVTKLVGAQTGEGAAYRVDLRLRPHGRVGALALSVKDTIRYYQTEAQAWERQVLIRSRASAGSANLYRDFYAAVENSVFQTNETVENALANVRRSKEKINLENAKSKNFNVKLGTGGIREIEFIAQALQLAHAGRDKWLRAAHTLKSLARLADRELLTENELTELFDAYDFLRRVEHILQMENGLQTHNLPDETEKLALLAKKMRLKTVKTFEKKLGFHTANVSRIFAGIFGTEKAYDEDFATANEKNARADELKNIIRFDAAQAEISDQPQEDRRRAETPGKLPAQLILSIEKAKLKINRKKLESLKILSKISPFFTAMIAANPSLIEHLPPNEGDFQISDFQVEMMSAVKNEPDYAARLAALRRTWARFLLEIAAFDVYGKMTRSQTKQAQTRLAEAGIEAALDITKKELSRRFSVAINDFPFAVLGLGKLGGKGMDYGSDLDLLLIYDDEKPLAVDNLSGAEFYSRAVEIFVAALSSLTREGLLYRVDLRLRPDGRNGATSLSRAAFLNYLETRAAVWEWLAYVKIRGAAGDLRLARETEADARRIIHENARNLQSSDAGRRQLQTETRRIREQLEQLKTDRAPSGEIDIKFGAGGMLDVYFAMRFLQLRDNIPDETEKRSTLFMLEKLLEKQVLNREDYANFAEGYEFLSELDHNLRLTVGRSTRIPLANKTALQTIAERMKLSSVNELLENLTVHRINIRKTFDNIL